MPRKSPEAQSEYYHANRDKYLAYGREYRKKNAALLVAKQRERRKAMTLAQRAEYAARRAEQQRVRREIAKNKGITEREKSPYSKQVYRLKTDNFVGGVF